KNPRRCGGLDARQRSERQMPLRNSLINRLRYGRAWDEWDEGARGIEAAATPTTAEPKPRSRRRRLVVPLMFATLFVAGAALSAGAGNQVRTMLEGQAAENAASADESATTDATAPTSTDPTTTDPSDASTPDSSGSDAAPSNSQPAAEPPAAAPVTQSAPTAAVKVAVQRAA